MDEMHDHGRVPDVDLGDGHTGYWVGWAPDRGLNPKWKNTPDVEKWGLEIHHTNSQGHPCAGFVTLDGEIQRLVDPNRTNRWEVVSMDPLTLTPSVLCSCGDHGWIRDGRWVRA